MNKSEVCVKLTRKNCKKVLVILEMFGENVSAGLRELFTNHGLIRVNEHIGYEESAGVFYKYICQPEHKTLVKPRELRNILAREHLKVGDVCAFATGHGKEVEIRILSKIDDSQWPFECKQKWVTEVYANFIRYATDEEKTLLEPKTTIVTLNPVATFTGSIPGQATCTREVWVNHYSDQEFHIHYNKNIAESLSRINKASGRDVQTVKATLTYDIPMTKV